MALRVGVIPALLTLAVGLGLIVAGLAMIFVPAAFIAAGAGILAGAWFLLDVPVQGERR